MLFRKKPSRVLAFVSPPSNGWRLGVFCGYAAFPSPWLDKVWRQLADWPRCRMSNVKQIYSRQPLEIFFKVRPGPAFLPLLLPRTHEILIIMVTASYKDSDFGNIKLQPSKLILQFLRYWMIAKESQSVIEATGIFFYGEKSVIRSVLWFDDLWFTVSNTKLLPDVAIHTHLRFSFLFSWALSSTYCSPNTLESRLFASYLFF